MIWAGFAVFTVATASMIALTFGHSLGIAGSALFLLTVIVVRPFAADYVEEHLRLERGVVAEEAVGRLLRELVYEGWHVMNDVTGLVPGNVDFIVSGPGGVFVVDVKARRYGERDPGRLKWTAKQLHDEIGVWVTPVICLHEREAEPSFRSGVAIVSSAQLPGWLRAQRKQVADPERLARFVDALF